VTSTDRQTRSYLMQLFAERGLHPRGDLGQNFLIDLNLIEFIVRQAELDQHDVVLEIGAGTGSLTAELAKQAGSVVSVEYDRTMHQLAAEAVSNCPNVTLLQCDALKNKNRFAPAVLDAVLDQLQAAPDRRLKLVANLPYNIATPVISNLVATDLPWVRMVATIQFELALRMIARPASEHYGALAIWLQSQCRVKILKRLPPNVFWPRPQVNSAIVRIAPHAVRREKIADCKFFHDHVRGVFLHRRKLLRGVLRGMYRGQLDPSEMDSLLREIGLAETARAEELSVQQHVELGNGLWSRRQRGELIGVGPSITR
jgi:16S rRNA (adenine1518-N6/adenine1519-N6)-dimethyltransferase